MRAIPDDPIIACMERTGRPPWEQRRRSWSEFGGWGWSGYDETEEYDPDDEMEEDDEEETEEHDELPGAPAGL